MDADSRRSKRDYRGFTRPTGVRGKLSDLDSAVLTSGNLGITADGRHVMVYLSDGEWIQADPGPFRVTIGNPDSNRDPWFDFMVV